MGRKKSEHVKEKTREVEKVEVVGKRKLVRYGKEVE